MSYSLFIENFIHPFIIYVLAGTLISYLLARVLIRFSLFKDARLRVIVFMIPFIVPVLAYFAHSPFSVKRCLVYGHELGYINNWLCFAGNVLAVILTPLFIGSVIFAVSRLVLSIWASRRFIRKYGFASREDQPGLFSLLDTLCSKAGIRVPRVVITDDRFARAFTMGYHTPVMVVSRGVLLGLDHEELETVLAHELGHIVRGDSLINSFVVFLKDLMFFSPLVFFIFRDFSFEKEKASDDFAIKLTEKPLAFAQALIKVWRLSPRTVLDSLLPYPNFVSHSGILENRVKRIVNNEHGVLKNTLFAYIGLVAAILFSIAVLYFVC